MFPCVLSIEETPPSSTIQEAKIQQLELAQDNKANKRIKSPFLYCIFSFSSFYLSVRIRTIRFKQDFHLTRAKGASRSLNMAHRYSRSEKGKWVADQPRSERRRPVQIPQSDNSDLIEDNKLSLIGRVTNPAVQKTQWVVEWLLQYWSVEGELTGRELGPELFQIRFKSEEALETVLRKGPYH